MEQIFQEVNKLQQLYISEYDKYNLEKIIREGLIDGLSEFEINKFIGDTCATLICKDPDFNKLAVIYEIKNIYLTTNNNYLECLEKQKNFNLLSDNYYQFVKSNIDVLNSMMVESRNYLIDFFGLKTLTRSYLLKNKNKQIIETPQMMFLRCAIQIHGLNYSKLKSNSKLNFNNSLDLIKETYDLMSQLYFTHATPTLFNSGRTYPQLSSCYLLQCSDDLDGISKSIGDIMKISKWAGGIGINLSEIRSNGSIIKSNGGTSNGIIPLCKVLESIARYINQSGLRAGSIAVYLEPWCADVFEFIELRKNTGDENLRTRDLFLALWIPNAFMKAVEADGPWYLMSQDVCPGLTDAYGSSFDLLYSDYVKQGKYIKEVKARELMTKIIESQIETGMPYMMYKDHVNEKTNQKNLGTIKSSNLCSEVVQKSSNEEIAVCNLASISLPMFVQNGKFDFDLLGKITQIVVNNLNNIIDMNFYPVPETAKSNLSHRPIGLGVQGLADTYIKMGFPFDSDSAFKLNKQIFECIYWNALTKSNQLAIQYGPYSSFEGSPFSKGLLQWHLAGKTIDDMDKELNLNWVGLIELIKKYGTTNSLITTIMPTASTAQIMNNTESIEPITSNLYVRKVLAGEYIVVNKYLVDDLKKLGLWNTQTYSELVYDNGSVQKMNLPEKLKEKYKTAYDIKQKVLVDQSVDRSIFIDQSQSLNLFWEQPNISKVYSSHIYGWKKGLKTGMYYLKSRPSTEAIKFGLDIEIEKDILNKRTNSNNKNNYETCESCSA